MPRDWPIPVKSVLLPNVVPWSSTNDLVLWLAVLIIGAINLTVSPVIPDGKFLIITFGGSVGALLTVISDAAIISSPPSVLLVSFIRIQFVLFAIGPYCSPLPEAVNVAVYWLPYTVAEVNIRLVS